MIENDTAPTASTATPTPTSTSGRGDACAARLLQRLGKVGDDLLGGGELAGDGLLRGGEVLASADS